MNISQLLAEQGDLTWGGIVDPVTYKVNENYWPGTDIPIRNVDRSRINALSAAVFTGDQTYQFGGKKNDLLTKLQKKNIQRLNKCQKLSKNKYQKNKCLNEFNKTWTEYSQFLKKNSIRKKRGYADRKVYTSKQQRKVMKLFFGKKK